LFCKTLPLQLADEKLGFGYATINAMDNQRSV
jgi:hypothetical protein